MISKRTIIILALGTIVIFGGLGVVLIPFVRGVDFSTYIFGDKALWIQVVIGLGFGAISAKAGWQIVEMPRLHKTKVFFTKIIQPLKLSKSEIFLISICAGVGEELFFRGAVQPVLGVWATSVLFVLLHGYLNPFNIPLTIYGIFMVLVIGVMGLFTEHIGILSAIIAHVTIDFILLQKLSEVNLKGNDTDSR